jgi:hypothetical protein
MLNTFAFGSVVRRIDVGFLTTICFHRERLDRGLRYGACMLYQSRFTSQARFDRMY